MYFPAFPFLQGIIIGLIIAIPLGPVGLIIMKRTAEFGLRAGIISTIAVVGVDTLAVISILLGLHHSIPIFEFIPRWLIVVGGIGFFGYGAYIAFAPKKEVPDESIPWQRHFGSSLLLTITNPSTYLSFAIIGVMVSRFTTKALSFRLELISGFFIGSSLWWAILIGIAFSQRKRYLGAKHIQKVIGIIIMVLAIMTCFGGTHEVRHFAHFFKNNHTPTIR